MPSLSHANPPRRFRRIIVFADRTDYSAFPTAVPMGLRMLAVQKNAVRTADAGVGYIDNKRSAVSS